MCLVTEDGATWAGGDAVARVVERLPLGKLIGRLLRLPVVRQILGVGYRLVADNRHSVSRLTGVAVCDPTETS